MSFTMPEPKDSVPAITEAECQSLEHNYGIDPAEGIENCQAIAEQILPLLKQELDAIKDSGDPENPNTVVIFANEDSKCKEGDPTPTIASILSRIYRLAQALACDICTYDPTLVARLKSGTASQILWGQGAGNLPKWVTPDKEIVEDSLNVATSGATFTAIKNAWLGTFHLWEDHEKFDFYAETLSDLQSQSGANTGDDALVLKGAGGTNQIYTYSGGSWSAGPVMGNIENFATTHILKGAWADKEIYFYYNDDSTTPTWNLLDASLGNIVGQIQALQEAAKQAVLSGDGNDYTVVTRETLAEAAKVDPIDGRTTIVLITQEYGCLENEGE